MASREFSLKVVQELTYTRQDEAGRLVALSEARLTEARQKLEALDSYRDQYAQQLIATGGSGVGIGQLRDLHAFIGRIDEAIAQHKLEIARLEQGWQSALEQWSTRRQAAKTMDALEERHLLNLEREDRRLDQKQQDEFASRRREHD
jgi:flagellar FliJ protein